LVTFLRESLGRTTACIREPGLCNPHFTCLDGSNNLALLAQVYV